MPDRFVRRADLIGDSVLDLEAQQTHDVINMQGDVGWLTRSDKRRLASHTRLTTERAECIRSWHGVRWLAWCQVVGMVSGAVTRLRLPNKGSDLVHVLSPLAVIS